MLLFVYVYFLFLLMLLLTVRSLQSIKVSPSKALLRVRHQLVFVDQCLRVVEKNLVLKIMMTIIAIYDIYDLFVIILSSSVILRE